MRVNISSFCILLLVVTLIIRPVVAAELPILPDQPVQTVTSGVDQNRLVSAQISQTIKTEMATVKQQLQDNEDENFRTLDQRTYQMMEDTKIRVIIGGIGAILLANAIVALVMARFWRQYSLEMYQRKIIDSVTEERDELKSRIETKEIQEMQQPDWHPQEPTQSLGMDVGQASAANMSMMNQWQTQAARPGAWVSPMDVDVQHYDYTQQPKYDNYQEQVDADWGAANKDIRSEWGGNK